MSSTSYKSFTAVTPTQPPPHATRAFPSAIQWGFLNHPVQSTSYGSSYYWYRVEGYLCPLHSTGALTAIQEVPSSSSTEHLAQNHLMVSILCFSVGKSEAIVTYAGQSEVFGGMVIKLEEVGSSRVSTHSAGFSCCKRNFLVVTCVPLTEAKNCFNFHLWLDVDIEIYVKVSSIKFMMLKFTYPLSTLQGILWITLV